MNIRNFKRGLSPIWLGAIVFLSATNAEATLLLQTGLVGGSGDVQNVLFNGFPNQQGTTVSGNLNQTNQQVNFTSTEALKTPAGGQARIEAVDGAFNYIEITLDDTGIGFGKLQFNIDAAANGSATITLRDQFGTDFVFSNQALGGNGQNFFTAYSMDNQVMVKATIDSTVAMTGLADLQQVRLGPTDLDPGPGPGPGIPVPAPLALFGLGGLMLGWSMKRKSRA